MRCTVAVLFVFALVPTASWGQNSLESAESSSNEDSAPLVESSAPAPDLAEDAPEPDAEAVVPQQEVLPVDTEAQPDTSGTPAGRTAAVAAGTTLGAVVGIAIGGLAGVQIGVNLAEPCGGMLCDLGPAMTGLMIGGSVGGIGGGMLGAAAVREGQTNQRQLVFGPSVHQGGGGLSLAGRF